MKTWSWKTWRWSLPSVAIVAASLAAFCAGGHFAAKALIQSQQMRQLGELTDVVLRRSEVAVDSGSASMDEIVKAGNIDCEPAALQAFRLRVYQRPGVKDVRLANSDGSVICSAYSETLEFDKGWVGRSDMLPSRDSSLLLFRVEQFGADALGVMRDRGDSRSLVAILGINSYLFDIMPAELRAHSTVTLKLTNGQALGEFSLDEIAVVHPIDFVRSSARYPLLAMISVDRAALARWNGQLYWPAMLLAALLGLVFGLVLIRTRRVEGPLAELDRALVREQFKPYYQPTFHLKSGAILGCEVLARWIRDDGSVVPPMNFIPLAESTGRIRPMTWQILNQALKDLNALLRERKEFKLSVNIVPSHLLDADFVPTLRRVVASAKVATRQIVLEITERDKLDDIARAAEVVRELRDLGFRVAIDDVGVGHSGLSQLKVLGATTMKIDKFFVDTITRDGSTTSIVEMLVRLAKDLAMTVIAEGIETADQVQALCSCGVEEGQGYLVSPPLPIAKFAELVEVQQAKSDIRAALDAAMVA
ncbi:EAL domain-containing protein [Bradyrhizobium sp. Tv2a-2]|uniref:EAL domain-containing protein n=1 Tax=Bradyrhizobium sp. Tv2a-2 TaxID=113395 RepID=UPI0004096E98|nr:EAL domain-containing protein [Bradyrhizobium sp. Tv2a-2]